MNTPIPFEGLPRFTDISHPSGRSRLFSLRPMHLGEPTQESLLSFLIRTARAHAVNPRELVGRVLAEVDPAIGLLAGAGFFRRLSKTVNGIGPYAECLASAIEEATQVGGLRRLTMLPWRGLFPSNGQGMLAEHPRWCPHCLFEQAQEERDRYVPLAWTLESVKGCARHGRRLEQHCPHCGKLQSFVPRYPDIGVCSECFKPLVTRDVLSAGEIGTPLSELEHWTSEAAGSMIARQASDQDEFTVEKFRRAIVALVDRSAGGNRAKFCRAIGMHERALSGWLTKGERPSMPQFLELCYRSGVDPVDIFGSEDQVEDVGRVRAGMERLRRRVSCSRPSARLRNEISARLRDWLASADCPPVSTIAKIVGLTARCLRYWFPELCNELSARHRTAALAGSREHQARQSARVREIVRHLTVEGKYPSRRRVGELLRKDGMSLAQPHLLRAYRDSR